MFDDISQDVARCGPDFGSRLKEMVFNTGMWAVMAYRFRRWVFELSLPRLLKLPLAALSMAVQLATEIVTKIQISCSAKIGPGLYIAHSGCIVIASSTVMGRNCTMAHGVTIGHGGGGDRTKQGSPIIGDRVYIGPGSALIGPIAVGDDALIGVGAIVTRAVPARGVVVGNPGRVLSCRGSFDLISYPGMEADPARQAALAAGRSDLEAALGPLPVRLPQSGAAELRRTEALTTRRISTETQSLP